MSSLEKEKLFEIKQALTTVTNKLGVPLYLLFWLLDLIYVPQYKWEFLGIRLLIIPTALILHWWLKHTNSIRQAEYAGLFLAFMGASILNVMIFIIGEGALYFIPLHLVAIAGLSAIPWSNRNFILVALIIYVPYLAIEVSWLKQTYSIAQFSVNIFFIVGIISVILVMKSYREKLHSLEISMRTDLEKEIEKRKQTEKELTIARDGALAATRAKESFLANMSHEIRTPLTAIIGYADTGLDHDQTTQQRIAALKTIRRSGDHLLGLINDVLDFSKIEAGELKVEKIPINPLQQVFDVESIIMGHANKKGLNIVIDYTFPMLKEINSDAIRIKQILINLCNNAIKFTNSGEVKITIQYEPKQHQLNFIVKDTGIGMTGEQLDKIFLPFKQADSSTSRRYGGTGLGLSLSTQLAELLDGQLIVNSELGEGSTFTLCLNLDEKSEEKYFNNIDEVPFNKDDYNSHVVKQKPLKGSILLVEDNTVNQELIQMYLEKMGAKVTCTGNGSIAVSLAKQHRYDLIYMDMQMPIMSGIEAVKVLRKEGHNEPIVMLTANASSDDKKQCMDAGANDFITKPIIRQTLYKTTARYLKETVSTSYQEPIYSALIQEEPRFEDLLYNFIDSLRQMEKQIIKTFRNNEFYAMAQVIHDLKGTAGGFGYPDLTKLAEDIEIRIKEKDYQEIEYFLDKLEVMCERIYQGAQQH